MLMGLDAASRSAGTEPPGWQDATPDRPSEQGKLKAESVLPVARGNCGALATRRSGLGRQAGRRAGGHRQAWQTWKEPEKNLCSLGCKNGTLIAAPKADQRLCRTVTTPGCMALPHLCTSCMSLACLGSPSEPAKSGLRLVASAQRGSTKR
jgi:hypothetical protein